MQYLKILAILIIALPIYTMDITKKRRIEKERFRITAIEELKKQSHSLAINFFNYYKQCPSCHVKIDEITEKGQQKTRRHLERCYKQKCNGSSEEEQIEEKRIMVINQLCNANIDPALQFMYEHGYCPLNCNEEIGNNHREHINGCFENGTGSSIDNLVQKNLYYKEEIRHTNERTNQCPVCSRTFNTKTKVNSHYHTEHMTEFIPCSE